MSYDNSQIGKKYNSLLVIKQSEVKKKMEKGCGNSSVIVETLIMQE